MAETNGKSGGFDEACTGLSQVAWASTCHCLLGNEEHLALLKLWVQPLELLNEAVSITDADGKCFLYVNRAWTAHFGHSLAQVLGTKLSGRNLRGLVRQSPLRALNGKVVAMLCVAKARGAGVKDRMVAATNGNGNGAPGQAWKEKVRTLTARELEVFQTMSHGLTTKQMGVRMGISIFTVQTHRTRIKKKLGASSNAALLALSFDWAAVPRQ